ncbi:hypothetical protein GPM19_10345 [Halomonas sp. ZH2S]|uniref:AntA/AntB antirepressor domain-containing protein n=1 Tax=Vreelandella zhuhanensis TaxID=2684210 RepID=A0A7X3H343_9GAMM|nr:antA/AntB antirepressor family protein [Halomonas zhuhanensis]MWJ28600.1 hypothetical protein [Halomonas zhuhanensis]
MSNKKTLRDGRSIIIDINHAPRKTLVSALEFTEEQADRMLKVRRVLPLVEDRQAPQVNARKLWERIGKPHREFRKWAEDYIKPMMAQETFALKSPKDFSTEIVQFYEQTKGRPKINYQVSRDFAAHLAMQARTLEGYEIRQYFLDMEECVLRMERYRPIRTEHLTEIDKSVYHSVISKTGSKLFAHDTERFLKGMVTEVVTGLPSSEWREALNKIAGTKGKGIRDVLNRDDLKVYRDALQFASSLIQSGITDRKQIQDMICTVHANKINPDRYLIGYALDKEAV